MCVFQPDSRDGAWPNGQVELQLREELEHSREQLNSAHNTLQELHNQIHQLMSTFSPSLYTPNTREHVSDGLSGVCVPPCVE